jgi:hypothetical protein
LADANRLVNPKRQSTSVWTASPLRFRDYLTTLVVVLLATLPFLNKAFHIDDVLYLQGAYQVLRGEDAFHGEVLWDAPDGQPASLFAIDHNPPLWKYLLAATIRWLAPDRAEWKLHLLESLFVWLAGFGLLQLGRRVSPYPVWSTAMILWSPFFLPGQNLMLEGPLLCFFTWSLELLCRSWETERARWAWGAGLCASLAVMTKYTGGMFLPLAFVSCLLVRRPRTLVCLVPPVVVLGAYFTHNQLLYSQSHISAHGVLYHIGEWPARILSELRTIGGLTVLTPVFAVAVARRFRHGWALVLLSLLLAAGLAWTDVTLVRQRAAAEGWIPLPFQEVHYVLFVMNGAVCMSMVLATAFLDSRPWAFSPRRFLEIWILLFFLFNITSVPFQAVRHLLLLLVPLTFLGSVWIGRLELSANWKKALLVVTALLGFGLATADYEIASAYRHVARTTVRTLIASGRRLWFTGNWGFVYYASQEGALPLVDDPQKFHMPPIEAGHIVVNPRIITFVIFPPENFPRIRAFEHEQPPASNVFRTIAPCVNYYSVHTHLLPWVFFVQGPDEGETEAYFQLAPLDDILYFELLANPR